MASRSSAAAASSVVVALVLAAASARADGSREPEQLFDQGKQLLADGKVAEACEKLARSQQLDPSLGTLGLLATCHEQEGKVAIALGEYREVARIAHAIGDPREAFAAQKAEELDHKVGKLRVVVGRPGALVDVRVDGVRLALDQLGTDVAVDPNKPLHLVARGSGPREHTVETRVSPGGRVTVDLPDLDPIAAPVVQPKKVTPATPRGADGRFIGAIVSGGFGVAGLAVASGFAVAAASSNSTSDVIAASCTTASACGAGKAAREDAQRSATIATVGLGVGVAGIATSAVLFVLSASSRSASSDRVGVNPLRIGASVDPRGGAATLIYSF